MTDMERIEQKLDLILSLIIQPEPVAPPVRYAKAKQEALTRRAHYDELANKRKLRQSGS